MENRGYGRDRRRKRNQQGNRGAALVLSLTGLLLVVVLLVFAFFPDRTGSLTELLREKAGKAGMEISVSAGAEASGGDALSGEQVLPSGAGSGKVSESGTGMQQIVVQRETTTPPETEAPPKYTENENTRWIGGDRPGTADSGAEESAQSSGGGTAAASADSENAPVTIRFAGDILFDSNYAIMATMLQRSGGTPDIETAFDPELLSLMRRADIFVVNNEFPYSSRGTPLPEKQFTFRADPAYAALLPAMGADLAVLANNHMYDYGEEALLDTLDTLGSLSTGRDVPSEAKTTVGERPSRSKGLPYIGAGRNLEEASAPFYFTNGKIKIGFVAATQIERLGNPDTKGATETSAGVFRCLNSENLLDVLEQMQSECDFIIAYLHWGTESTDQVDEHQLRLAKEVAAAGADLIIGDHPHVLQEIGMVDGVPVIYSLGNYLFNSGAQDTCLISAELDPDTAELKSLQFLPARQEGCKTKLLAGSEQLRVIDYMRSISEVSIDDEGYVTLP